MIDLASNFEGTARAWPKCAKCSAALGRPYPVERLELEPEEEKARHVNGRFALVVKVSCHGEDMRCAIERATYFTQGMLMQSLAHVYAFVLRNGRYACEVRRGTRGQAPGILEAKVH